MEINFDTHFDQQGGSPQWGNFLMPYIAAQGTTYIRDNLNWVALEHNGQGVYGIWQQKLDWINAAHAQGLKIVACVDAGGGQSATYYADQFDATAYSNAVAWLAVQKDNAGNPLVDVIEILNEANNIFKSYETSKGNGATWRDVYANLFNTTYAAVKAVNPSVPVIGIGLQGADVLYCLSKIPSIDGVVYHPYDTGSDIPETAYEPGAAGYPSYSAFVADVRAATTAPIWETERGGDRGKSEYESAVWTARRTLIQEGLKVEHSFFYDFIDSDPMQSALDFFDHPRQVLYVIQRLRKALAGFVSTGSGVSIATPPTNFMSYVYSSSTAKVAAVWIGNAAPAKSPEVGSQAPVIVSFNVGSTFPASLMDVISGDIQPILSVGAANTGNLPQWSDNAGTLVNIPVSGQPRLVIPGGGPSAPPPAPTYKTWVAAEDKELTAVWKGPWLAQHMDAWRLTHPITPDTP